LNSGRSAPRSSHSRVLISAAILPDGLSEDVLSFAITEIIKLRGISRQGVDMSQSLLSDLLGRQGVLRLGDWFEGDHQSVNSLEILKLLS
jgi:hypothetical protein